MNYGFRVTNHCKGQIAEGQRVGNPRYSRLKTCASTPYIIAVLVNVFRCSLGAAENPAENYRSLGYLYLSPVPQAEYVSPETKYVLVRFNDISPVELTNLSSFISVSGAVSGPHAGDTRIATDGRTVIHELQDGFRENELVTVTLNPKWRQGSGPAVGAYQYDFVAGGSFLESSAIGQWLVPNGKWEMGNGAEASLSAAKQKSASAPSKPRRSPARKLAVGKPTVMPNGVSVPSDFPLINITINDNPDPGLIFIDTRGGNGKPYNVIFDNTGVPVWYQLMPDERHDMKVQQNGVLTMLAWDNDIYYYALNTNYQKIAEYRAVNGYSTDEHELVVLPDGKYLLIGRRYNEVDMTRYVSGANTNAYVGETVIQEFTPAGELIFQWRAWDNYDVRDVHLDDPRSETFRFPHMNALEVDSDGHILVSCRHLSEVTKINRDTGEMIWRLGGAHSDFTFENDPLNGFRNQHTARTAGENRYLLFDNGDLHSPMVSRAVEYELDLTNKTARVVWQYPETPTTDLFSHYMGNTQRLPNGNTLINWAIGNLPKLTEVRPDGTKAFEMNWADQFETYRVWRCSWQGYALSPNLVVEGFPDRLVLIFNKFGDPNVAHYRIYGGTAPNPTNLLATSTTTLATMNNLEHQQQYYFRVTAVNSNGVESAYSEEKSIFVNTAAPGENMVSNPGFSLGQSGWTLSTNENTSAAWSVAGPENAAFVEILSPGAALADIQLLQSGLWLAQGQEYVLAFDSWANAPRVMEVALSQGQPPFTTHRVVTASITPVRQTFSYAFVMQNATDLNARLAFNLGSLTGNVYLDNVVVFRLNPGDFDKDQLVDGKDFSTFTGQWLDQGSSLSADLNRDGRINFLDFAEFGQNWTRE